MHGFSASKNHAHYEATKGGLNMFTKSVAIELAEYGITVNCVAPGAIEVERYFATNPNYDREAMGKKIPVGRVGFLASDGARYITGETILVDGGLIARMAL